MGLDWAGTGLEMGAAMCTQKRSLGWGLKRRLGKGLKQAETGVGMWFETDWAGTGLGTGAAIRIKSEAGMEPETGAGTRLATHVEPDRLRRYFAVLVVGLALVLLYDNLGRVL